VKPKVHVFGHCHGLRGAQVLEVEQSIKPRELKKSKEFKEEEESIDEPSITEQQSNQSNILFINAAMERRGAQYPPVVFDYYI